MLSIDRQEPERTGRGFVVGAVLAAVTGMLVALAGCNTTEGAGKDIKSLGAGIEEKANNAKHND